MTMINILDSAIYNKISAGEVVERPSSIVKELVENAIDAGGKNISISVIGGGIEEISVTDDGCGIDFDDVEKAFYPHATSKICDEKDLYSIATLGFRGEALASVAAVSKVCLSSKPSTQQTGKRVEVHGGEFVSSSEIGCADGTVVTVKHLFYNTPARKKFLKKPKQEESEITNLISRYILIHPQISFRYTADNKIVFQSVGTGLKDALFTVYGSDAVENVISVENEYLGMRISGYIGKPSFTKPNRTYQTIALNGRYIVNNQVSVAIFNAFSDYLMKRAYPFYVLNLEIPLDKVDVNVHPNKMDVRFERANEIFSLVYNSVCRAISDYNHAEVKKIGAIFTDNHASICQEEKRDENTLFPAVDDRVQKNPVNVVSFVNMLQIKQQPLTFMDVRNQEVDPKNALPTTVTDSLSASASSLKAIENRCECVATIPSVQTGIDMKLSYRTIGQIFHTYIVIELEDKMLLIDQHAAHERFLYDKFINHAAQRGDMQPLLIPYIFSVNIQEANFIAEQIEDLRALAFDIEEFGENAFKLSAVPAELSEINLKYFIDEILADFHGKKGGREKFSKEYYAGKACKAAIKAGKPLSAMEIESILKYVTTGEVLQCPHGRPIVITIAKGEIEKWFKRIV